MFARSEGPINRNLYEETRNIPGCILMACQAFVMLFLFLLTMHVYSNPGSAPNAVEVFKGRFFQCFFLLFLVVHALRAAFFLKWVLITRAEIIYMPLPAYLIPGLAWRVSIDSIADVTIVDFQQIVARLERDGAGNGAKIRYWSRRGTTRKPFHSVKLVEGRNIPLRVWGFSAEKMGILLTLKNGADLFIDFQNPGEAVVAILQARMTQA